MNKTKKSLLFSGLALMMSALLLVGTTFAWFTDSVTNKGNVITSGNLSIEAVAYDVDTAKDTYTIPGVNNGNAFGFKDQGTNLKGENVPAIIDEKLWEPGVSNAKLLTVTNTGSLATNVQVKFDVKDGGLMNALWFDFINVENGQFTKRPMSQLAALGDATTVTLEAKESVSFILVYGMNEEAGNEYQGKDFSADVKIIATQATVEKDGFNNDQYDADATGDYADYNVTTEEELKTALENGGTVMLCNDIELDEAVTVSGKKLVLDLNGKELLYSAAGKNGVFKISDGADVTIKNGTVNMPNAPYYGFYVLDTAKLTLDSVVASSNDALVFGAGQETIVIRNCDLTTSYPIYHNGSTSPATLSIFDSYIKGGVYCSNASLPGRERQTLTIENSTIEGPTAVEFKHTDATITNCTLVGTDTPTDSGSNNNGSCTSGYAVAVTTNAVDDYVTGNVVIDNCKVYSGSVGEEENGYYFVYRVADGFSVTIDGEKVSDYNTYG